VSRLVGARVTRVEDRRVLTGRGRYVDDERPAHALHAVFVRSQVPHGELMAVDVAAALAAPGVVGVWTAADLAHLEPFRPVGPPELATPQYRALADDRVRFVGEPVALVVATTRAAAEDAAELVEVDVDPLTPVVTIDDALDPSRPPLFPEVGTNVLFRRHDEWGDTDGVFATAPHIIEIDLELSRHANCPLEGRALLALPEPGGGLTVVAAHQNPHALRVALAHHLGMPAHGVVVRCGDIGGSFGQKAYTSREDVAVAAAAVALGRPVAWVEDRSENLLAAGHARDERLHVAAAVDGEGTVLALRASMTLNQGAYQLTTLPSSIFPTLVRVLLPGALRVEHYAFDATVVASNAGTYVAYRGPWAAETFARERVLDRVAAELGLDPVVVRQRNLIRGDELPRRMVTGPTLEHVTAQETLAEAVRLAELPAFRASQVAARTEGRYLGFGLATFIEPSPGPPDYSAALGVGASPRTAQRATARLEPDGTLTVVTSQQPHGQGHETTLAQLAADGLGLPLESVHVVVGDTRLTPFNLVGTGGSRAATLASGAVVGAVGTLREQIIEIFAHVVEADPADVEVVEGRAQVRGVPARSMPLRDVARIAYVETSRLPASAAPGLDVAFDYAIPPGGWSQATHACWVEVDPDLGTVRILRYLVVGDCGEPINPGIVEGQVCGGVAQGIGSVLLERFVLSPDGQPLTTTFMDYLVPTATDIPPIEVHHLASPPQGPIDHRGVGEGGAIGAPPALCNAIEDALAPFGIVLREQHLPPSRLAALVAEARARSAVE
jgi:aerobic carbon-monoxide dehydrogenase large subunit